MKAPSERRTTPEVFVIWYTSQLRIGCVVEHGVVAADGRVLAGAYETCGAGEVDDGRTGIVGERRPVCAGRKLADVTGAVPRQNRRRRAHGRSKAHAPTGGVAGNGENSRHGAARRHASRIGPRSRPGWVG